jgi:uncharacterized protein YjbI with pentapeptide repeats
MNDTTASGFDGAAWAEQLLVLNPWARDAPICEHDEAFKSARKCSSLKRYSQGRAHWNAWANGMIAKRKLLEEAGIWVGVHAWDRELELGREAGQNHETRYWLSLAVADFADHAFTTSCNFVGFIFPSEANFSGTRLEGMADFQAARFCGCARFDKTQFCANSWFRYVLFTGDAGFRDGQFNGEARFSESRFVRGAWFKGATFRGPAGFRRADFAFAGFEGAEFLDHANFGDRAQYGSAKFIGAQFRGKVWFDQATFAHNVWFSNAHFYHGNKPIDPATGRELTHDVAPDFSGITAERAFALDGTKFDVLPNFTQASFAEAPRLDNLTLAPTVEPGDFMRSFRRTDRSVASRYRALKRLAIQGHDHEREHQFFKGELRSRRNNEDKWWHGAFWFGILYDVLSDFGRSLLRPFVFWVGAFAAFAGAYFSLAAIPNAARPVGPVCGALVNAVQLSFKNALINLGGGGRDPTMQIYRCLFGLDIPNSVFFVELTQTLLSAALIFLLLLALRNRFRIQ